MSDARLPRSAAARGKVAPAKLAHFVVRTMFDRLDEVAAWYRTVLEAEIVYANPLMQFLTYDEEHHRMAILAMPGLTERPLQAVGVDHVAFTYAGLGDLIHTYERLKAHGIEPALPIHHGGTLSLYYLDPDKNQVELQIDVFDDLAELDAFMRSGKFAENPVGVVFDPDDLARRYHAGVPEAELKKPIDGPMPPLDAFPVH
jgi:catechol 2,3-dioxygenase-like lactoylglutathione lyase family enzyme